VGDRLGSDGRDDECCRDDECLDERGRDDDARRSSCRLPDDECFLDRDEARSRPEEARRESGTEEDLIRGDPDDARVRGEEPIPRCILSNSISFPPFFSGQNVEQIQRSITRKTANNPAPQAQEADVHLSG